MSADYRQSNQSRSNSSGLTGWIMHHSGGLISTPSQANVMFVVIILIALGIIFYFLSTTQNTGEIVAPAGETVVYPADAPPRLE